MQGIRVIDVSSFLAGPFCSTQLAEFGAEVIKIELPKVGDALRKFGTITKGGDSLPWLQECRNKKSATLDLRKPEGAEILKRLVSQADVLVENFQPGTLEKWGLGWDVLKMQNHKLVMVRISGFGQTGPYSPRPGFGRIGNAFGGLSYLAGYPDRAPVTPGSATIPDYLAGLYGALGVMFALRARDMTGRGQFIDIGLYEPIFRILDELAASYHYTGYVRERMGPGTVNVVPHSHYPTKDGKWIAIACTSDKIFARLAELQGEPGLAGEGKWGKVNGQRSGSVGGRRLGHAMDPEAPTRGVDRALHRVRGSVRAGQLDCRDLRGPAIQGTREHQVLQGPARRRDRHAERVPAAVRHARLDRVAGACARRAQ